MLEALRGMDVDDVIKIRVNDKGSYQAAVYRYRKKYKIERKFTLRRYDDKHYKVYRVK
jgi:hypothetical protein